MIGFADYAKICNNYCVCYFGYSDEYLIQLRLVRPFIERAFPDLKLYLGCKDELRHLIGNERTVSRSEMNRSMFAHSKELEFNGKDHPVEEFLQEAGINECPYDSCLVKPQTTRCVIISKGSYPTKNLTEDQIDMLKHRARCEGFKPEVDTKVDGAGFVLGVESVGLFQAALQGINTHLVPLGVGTRFAKKLFPNLEILSL